MVHWAHSCGLACTKLPRFEVESQASIVYSSKLYTFDPSKDQDVVMDTNDLL